MCAYGESHGEESYQDLRFGIRFADCLTRRSPADIGAGEEKTLYPAMAPLNQYLMPDQNSEIALARSAAPSSISDGAEVMELGRGGIHDAVKGTNGLCIVERSWGAATDHPEFRNPKVRSPVCFNPPAARTFAAI
jgi:hypothetical protein